MSVGYNMPDGSKRVVVTGMGAVSPAGVGVNALWNVLLDGRCCLGKIDRFDPDLVEMHIAGQVKDFDPEACGLHKKEVRRYDPFLQYAVIAAREAFAQSGIDMSSQDPDRCATVVGSGVGGLETMEREHKVLLDKGAKRISPFFIPMMISNIAAGTIAIETGFKGHCLDVTSACATGTHAIGEAYRLLRHGYADVCMAGGSEGTITPMCIAGFTNLSALSHGTDPQNASLPFDLNRSGFVAGEGAGMLLLETLEHADLRGAQIFAEIAGYGSTCDAYHITAPAPHGEGSKKAMKQALDQAGACPDEVDHVNAHGTATKMNDLCESEAIRALFAEHADKMYITSIKGALGHMLGAAGAVEAIETVLTVRHGVIPKTVGFSTPDPECPVLVAREAVEMPVKAAVSNSLGFGGHNAALVIKAFE